MQSVAQGWLVLKLTNSALMLGVVSFAGYLPVLLVTLFAGVIVDHADRRRLIVTTQVLLMLSAFILAALTWAGVVRVEYVIILAAVNGLVTAFDMPARQTFVVEMVGREDLPNAIALNSMIFNGARVVGPAVAGVLISVIGIAGCFFLNGLSYIAVIWSLLAMELVARELPRIGSAMFTRLREGFDYIWHHRASFYLLLLIALNAGFGMQYSVLIPVFARDVLHGGARAYGFLLAAQGVGALLGGFVLASSQDAARTSSESHLRPVRLRSRNFRFWLFVPDVAVAAGADADRRGAAQLHGDQQHDAPVVRVGRAARARDEHVHAVVHRARADWQPRGRLYRRAHEPANRGRGVGRRGARLRRHPAREALRHRRRAGRARSGGLNAWPGPRRCG